MKAWPFFAVWMLVQCCRGQELRTHSVYCGRQTAEGDYSISVSILESKNAGERGLEVFMDRGHVPPIKYSDVTVQVYSTTNDPLEVLTAEKTPDVYRLFGDAEQGGSYTFKLQESAHAHAVKVTWHHVTLTFLIPEASAAIVHEGGETILEASFASSNVPPIKPEEAELRAFGAHGPKLNVVRQDTGVRTPVPTKEGGEGIVRYRVILQPGQKVGYVYLDWSGKYIAFCDPGIPPR